MKRSIVVVGGGFAGFWAAIAARRVAPTNNDVLLVSRSPVLQIRPRLYEARPEELAVELPSLLDTVGVLFLEQEVIGIDHAGRRVHLASDDHVDYERLVVATGSAMRRPPVRGADECFSIDTQDEAVLFDRRLAQIARSGTKPTLVVVGAGFTGIELVLELRDRLVAHAARSPAEGARLILIDRAVVVGPELGDSPRPIIESALEAARVELSLGSSIVQLSDTRIGFSDGTTLEADAVVLTTGLRAEQLVRQVPGNFDELGRIFVEQSLRAPLAPEILVAGDAAAVDGGDGHTVVQSCQHALQMGRFAGENAARDLIGAPTIPYVQPSYVTCLDLGRSGAILTRGWNRRIELTGATANAVKRRINTEVIYPPINASRAELLALSSTDPSEQRFSRRVTKQVAATPTV